MFKEGWPFAAVAAVGVAIFFVLRLLLPTGESALPPLPIAPEPPAPVFSVALPAPPAAPKLRAKEPKVVARTVSRPVVAAPKAPVRVARKPAATKPKPAPPAPPAPAPEPVRLIASVQPAAPNASPGRAKRGKGPPPGHVRKAKKQEPPVVIEGVIVPENPSPGREKHDKGLPPGHAKKE
ncbi:MAG: hypothetical protein WD067_04100 [Gaiellaceae bacterium]